MFLPQPCSWSVEIEDGGPVWLGSGSTVCAIDMLSWEFSNLGLLKVMKLSLADSCFPCEFLELQVFGQFALITIHQPTLHTIPPLKWSQVKGSCVDVSGDSSMNGWQRNGPGRSKVAFHTESRANNLPNYHPLISAVGGPRPLIWRCVGDSYCDQAPSLLVIDSVDGNSKGTTESIRYKRGMQMQINVTFVNCMSWIRESNLHSGLSLPCGGSGSFLMEMGTFLFSIYISVNKKKSPTKLRRNKLFEKMQMVSVWYLWLVG